MALVREKDGKRLHVKSALMGESLVSKEFISQLDIAPQERLYPDIAIMKIGGQSICDRGVKALPAILKEIVKMQTELHNAERVKKLEAAMIQAIKLAPLESQQAFLVQYEAILKEQE